VVDLGALAAADWHRWHTGRVATGDIDSYLAGVDEPKRGTLEEGISRLTVRTVRATT
jgi:hypothetical protein